MSSTSRVIGAVGCVGARRQASRGGDAGGCPLFRAGSRGGETLPLASLLLAADGSALGASRQRSALTELTAEGSHADG